MYASLRLESYKKNIAPPSWPKFRSNPQELNDLFSIARRMRDYCTFWVKPLAGDAATFVEKAHHV
jgi:hypothetical protein